MPRGNHKMADIPYGTWILRVEEHNRLRLPLEIRSVVNWLNVEQAIDCVGTLGTAGGVQIEPLATHETLRRPFIEALGDTPPRSSESGQKWVDAARLMATSWRMPISIEKSGRPSITVPEPTRRAGQLPGAGGIIVVFGFGEILEIWDSLKWHEYVRAVAETKLAVVSEAIEDLGRR